MKQFLILLQTIVYLSLLGCSSEPTVLKAVESIDVDQFMGEWYVISNIAYFAENNKVGSKTTYLRAPDNTYQDIFESKDGSFNNETDKLIGSIKSTNVSNSKWESTFYWVIRFKFEVLEIDEDYQIVLLGHKSRDYGWVMARDKSISDEDYDKAMQTFKNNGYDTEKFGKVPQFPKDIGAPGYHLVTN